MASRNVNRSLTPSSVCIVNDDGSITFRGKRVVVPDVSLEVVVGAGANGFVMKGHHRILLVPLAIKFWVSLRSHDARDKMAQGVAEIKKLIEAEHYRSVVLWRTAGEAEGIFYATMDLCSGQTLDSWLKDPHPLGLRRRLAYSLVDEVCGMAHQGLYHGDLHARNVMVEDAPLSDTMPRFRIIDFGTSMFASRRVSRRRHWRVFTETIDRLISPFAIRTLAQTSLRPSDTAASLRAWYHECLSSIRHALIRFGADWLIDAEERHDFEKREWKSREVMLGEFFPVPRTVMDSASKLVVSERSNAATIERLKTGHFK